MQWCMIAQYGLRNQRGGSLLPGACNLAHFRRALMQCAALRAHVGAPQQLVGVHAGGAAVAPGFGCTHRHELAARVRYYLKA